MSFSQHTIKRRLRLSTYWTVEDVVYGAYGPILNTTTHNHAYHPHYKQSYAGFSSALTEAVDTLRPHFISIQKASYANFEDLYEKVKNLISSIKGIGPVAYYDIALRIGCNLTPKVIPQKYVYTHGNKVEEAAKVLLPTVAIIDGKIEASLFSSIIPHYSAMEIEDILCVYSTQIKEKGYFDYEWLKLEVKE